MTQMGGLRERGVKDTVDFGARSSGSGKSRVTALRWGRLCEEQMWGPYQELDCGHMKGRDTKGILLDIEHKAPRQVNIHTYGSAMRPS